jgi:4-hydroxythreonine-4-phosphate dehydrogenase
LNISYKLEGNKLEIFNKVIHIKEIEKNSHSESMNSLSSAIKTITNDDILITMPTSKNEINDGQKQYSGHTHYFRENVNSSASMLFKYKNTYCLLISDHIPLSEVHEIKPEQFEQCFTQSYNSIQKKFSFNGDVYFAGLNPHAGEDGLLGDEEKKHQQVLDNIAHKYHLNNNFIPADTIHYLHSTSRDQLFVYFYHDQGLTFFKNTFGLFGINITLNLPFLRFSVDHGTAFDLYKKNSANFLGTYYVINEALKIHG